MNFDPEIYRKYNEDLKSLDDDALRAHYHEHRHEPRIYSAANSTAEFLSQRWLRGNGIEIGAGANPTPLFGTAQSVVGDVDITGVFGGSGVNIHKSVDHLQFANGLESKFDFAIASHVLEHVDSFLRALKNLLTITVDGGVIYLVLPDIDFLMDHHWLPEFEFDHHIIEFGDALHFSQLHDRLYLEASVGGMDELNDHANLSDAYKNNVRKGVIPADQRFMHHKHNYNYQGWIELILNAQKFFASGFRILDARYGHERKDCHFVLQKIESNLDSPALARRGLS